MVHNMGGMRSKFAVFIFAFFVLRMVSKLTQRQCQKTNECEIFEVKSDNLPKYKTISHILPFSYKLNCYPWH